MRTHCRTTATRLPLHLLFAPVMPLRAVGESREDFEDAMLFPVCDQPPPEATHDEEDRAGEPRGSNQAPAMGWPKKKAPAKA